MEVRTEDRFERVYREEADRLWRALLAFSGDHSVASDAVSEAFTQALARGSAIRDPARWIWKAAFRIASGDLQRAARDRPSAVVVAADAGADMSDESLALLSAIRQLSARQRAVVVLHYLTDLPTAEVARRLGVRSVTVRVHLNQARKRLRELLEEDDG